MNKERVVIKVGSAVLTQNGSVALDRMKALVELIAKLKETKDVVLVSSGAVAAGSTKIKLDKSVLKNKQALAAIGQPILMKKYAKKFEKFDVIVAQVLVTAKNLNSEDDLNRVKATIDTLLENGVLPIVNENDATATDELVVGDNDQLSAYITKAVEAKMLVILSDIDAYYDKDPRKYSDAKPIKLMNSIPRNELNKDVTPHGEYATGGIVTKLKAANFLLNNKIDTFLASGFELDDAKNFLLESKQTGGTLFKALL